MYMSIFLFGSSDVDKLKKLILHNPYILTLPEVGEVKDEVIPKNVQQFWVRIVIPYHEFNVFQLFSAFNFFKNSNYFFFFIKSLG